MKFNNKVFLAVSALVIGLSVSVVDPVHASDGCQRGYYRNSTSTPCVKTSWTSGSYLSDDYEGFDVHAVAVPADSMINVGSTGSSPEEIRTWIQIDCPSGTDAPSNFFTNRYKVSLRQSPEIVDFGHKGVVELKIDNQPWSKSIRIEYNVQYSDPEALVLVPSATNRFARLLKAAKKTVSIRLVTTSLRAKTSGWTYPSISGVKNFGTFTKTNFSKEWSKLVNKSSCKFGN